MKTPQHILDRNRKWRIKNREQVVAQVKRWQEANPEKTLEYKRRYREENRERLNEEARIRRKQQWAADPETARAKARAYYWKNKERCDAHSRAYQKRSKHSVRWRKEHPERWRQLNIERQKRYAKKHPDRVRLYARIGKLRRRAAGYISIHDWNHILRKHKFRCAYCGKKTKLEADHIIPVALGGTSDPSNIQPLCRSCNARKWKFIDKHPQMSLPFNL